MFVTVPQQDLEIDILKTWITRIQQVVGSDIQVLPKYPDINENLKLPVVVLERVSDERTALPRNSGFIWYSNCSTPNTLERIEGYRFILGYQLNVITHSNSSLLSLTGKIREMLVNPNNKSFADDWFPWGWQFIPLLHFARVSNVWDPTDLRICYKFPKITGVMIPAFDSEELHQYSFTIPFWCDYVVPRSIDKILSIGDVVTPK